MKIRATWFGVMLATAVLLRAPAMAQDPAAADPMAAAHAQHAQLLNTPTAARRPEQYQAIVDTLAAAWADPAAPDADAARFEAAAIYAAEARDLREESAYKQAASELQALLKAHPFTAYRRNAEWSLAQIQIFHLHEAVAADVWLRDFDTRYPADPRVSIAEQELRGVRVPEPAYLDGPAPTASSEPAATPDAPPAAAVPVPAPGPAREPAPPVGVDGERTFNAGIGPVTTINVLPNAGGASVVIHLKGEATVTRGDVPETHRVYFDLHLPGVAATGAPKTFNFNAGGIDSIRIAEYQPGIVRVVLVLASGGFEVSAGKFFPNPDRLIVAVRPR